MLNSVKHKLVSEGKLGPSVKAGEIGDSPLIKGGPQTTAGYMPAKIDKKTMSKKDIDDNLYSIDDLSYDEDEETKKKTKKAAVNKVNAVKAKKKAEEDEEELVKESGKIAKERLNNFMRRKSIFDKLYENVMQPGGEHGGADEMDNSQELDALGIEGGEEDGLEEEGGEVTFTLDRATAEKLIDVLSAAIGGGHEEYEGENEFGGEEDTDEYGGEEDEEGFWDEDEEDLGASNLTKEVNFGKNNKVGNLKVQKQSVQSGYTDKVGADGDHGHALVNAKQPNFGKDNKINSVLKNASGKKAFEV
jgi:hypothetical protein